MTKTVRSLDKDIKKIQDKKKENIKSIIQEVKTCKIPFYIKKLQKFQNEKKKEKIFSLYEIESFICRLGIDLQITKKVIKEAMINEKYKRCWCRGHNKMCGRCKGVGYEH